MSKSVPVSTLVSPEPKQRLQRLAAETDRSEADLVAQAIEQFVDLNAWQVAEIRERFAAAKAGEPGIAHERVAEWLESWGTDHELPPPRADRDRP
jgi:predicted transcriptional regulator